jgi:hypothetical protein
MNIFCILANKKQHNIEEFASQYEVSLTVFTIAMVISIFCIYLSWTCNTIMQTDTFLKIIYAFFAWFFGIFYLVFYFFNNYLGNGCSKV